MTDSTKSVSPKFRIQTLFYWCNDIATTRHFYSELIGLEETYCKDDDEAGWLNYHVDGIDIVFMRTSQTVQSQMEWAKQPGYLGGTAETHSFIVSVPTEAFPAVVKRLQEASIEAYQSEPSNNQYFVRDPMGTTIEIFVG